MHAGPAVHHNLTTSLTLSTRAGQAKGHEQLQVVTNFKLAPVCAPDLSQNLASAFSWHDEEAYGTRVQNSRSEGSRLALDSGWFARSLAIFAVASARTLCLVTTRASLPLPLALSRLATSISPPARIGQLLTPCRQFAPSRPPASPTSRLFLLAGLAFVSLATTLAGRPFLH